MTSIMERNIKYNFPEKKKTFIPILTDINIRTGKTQNQSFNSSITIISLKIYNFFTTTTESRVGTKWIPPLSFFSILFIQSYFLRNQTDSKDLKLLQRRKLYQYRSKIPQKKKKKNTKTNPLPSRH